MASRMTTPKGQKLCSLKRVSKDVFEGEQLLYLTQFILLYVLNTSLVIYEMRLRCSRRDLASSLYAPPCLRDRSCNLAIRDITPYVTCVT